MRHKISEGFLMNQSRKLIGNGKKENGKTTASPKQGQ